jgi:primase-polymerase (primpol)-like protein
LPRFQGINDCWNFKREKGSGHGALLPEDRTISKLECDKASGAANGQKFSKLWAGEWQGSYPSQSEADAALCSILAFYVGPDTERIDRLFRRSGLMRSKWDAKHYSDGSTYGQVTIARVLTLDSGGNSSKGTGETLSIPSLNATDGNLNRITQEAWQAVHNINKPPQFFRQGNLLVRIEKDSAGRPIFKELTVDRCIYHLAQAGRC